MLYGLILLCLSFFGATQIASANSEIDFPSFRSESNRQTSTVKLGYIRSKDEISIKIKKSSLENDTYIFGVNCSNGTNCNQGASQSIAKLVKFFRQGRSVLLVDADSNESSASAPYARWKIIDENKKYLFVAPDENNQNISLNILYGNTAWAQKLTVFDRYYHDFQTSNSGVWFRESLRYNINLASGEDGADTFTVYLLDPKLSKKVFDEKLPRPDIGFFVNGTTSNNQDIYDGIKPFNPMQLKSVRWNRAQEVEWIIGGDLTDEIYSLLESAVLDWNKYLPTGLRLTVRRAEKDDSLDSPLTNSIIYRATGKIGGSASFSYHPKSGEIFRASIILWGPKELSNAIQPAVIEPKSSFEYGSLAIQSRCELQNLSAVSKTNEVADAVRGAIQHEMGHALGLRHNFKGSLWDMDKISHPGGSSVMDYLPNFKDLKIGPYDVDAINWGYFDKDPSGNFPFCTDETAGFMIFMPAKDPACLRYDLTTNDPFSTYLARLRRVILDLIPQGKTQDEQSGLIDMAFVFPALRDENALGYNRKNFYEVLSILDEIPSLPSNASGDVAKAQWQLVSQVFSVIDSNIRIGKFLSFRNFYPHQSSLVNVADWVAKTPARDDALFENRKTIAQIIQRWSDDPYGKTISDYFNQSLIKHASSSDTDLAIENDFLLKMPRKQFNNFLQKRFR